MHHPPGRGLSALVRSRDQSRNMRQTDDFRFCVPFSCGSDEGWGGYEGGVPDEAKTGVPVVRR